MKQEYIDKIVDADLILVGIGSEFEKDKISREPKAVEALTELKKILEKRNYFIVTTCTNDIIRTVGFSADRIVSPCGNLEKKQCPNHCEGSLQELTISEQQQVNAANAAMEKLELGVCTDCGAKLVLNNVYATEYDENGYLDSWKLYTKWLQGTLNKKLCVLELGVDFSFPTIIRWPFEKVAFYNQKAVFIRVNEKLYHMSEELKDKGIAVEQNAIDWLLVKEI